MSFFEELKRRNVFRVGIAYVISAWVLLQFVDLVLENIQAPDWIMKVFMLALAVGFPLAVFFAWAFELTPEGIKKEKDVDRSKSIANTTGHKLDRSIIVILLIAVIYFAWDNFNPPTTSTEPVQPGGQSSVQEASAPKSIAVLPFADLSQAQNQEWFADGLTEEILNALAKTPDLLVSSRTSSFRYKGTTLDIPDIARELGVAHVLEGSVRSSGERIRVTAQLIRANDGFHIWSENYDRDLADMIEIQEDLALNIANALETTMDPQALAAMLNTGTRSVEAYEAYLRGLSLKQKSRSSHERGKLFLEAYEHNELARSIDPGFAAAHDQAADFWKTQLSPASVSSGLTDLEPVQMLTEFNERIDQAIAAAPNAVDKKGYMATKALVELRLNDATRLSLEYVKERPNNALGRFVLYESAANSSNSRVRKEVMDYWRERGSSDSEAAFNYTNLAYSVIDPSVAADFGLEAIKRWPNHNGLMYQTHRTLLWAGRIPEAREIADHYSRLFPEDDQLVRARQACAEGRRMDAEAIYAGLDPADSYDLSARWHILKLLGEDQKATEVLRHFADSGVPFELANFLHYKSFDPRPFRDIMAVLDREGINRPPPVEIPFKCPPPEQTSIAVLPFVNMSTDADNEFFSDGISEEILNVLASIPDLKVAARTSAFAYKGANKKISEIAEELGVNHILEGSVRKFGNQVRVTAQLIKADDGFHLWSDNYDRELTNIFVIQDEIAASIADALKVSLELEKGATGNLTGTNSIEAYEHYLKGMSLWHLRTADSVTRSIEEFDKAIALDPRFSKAHGGLSLAWVTIGGYLQMDSGITWEKAEAAANKALSLDPENVEALAALAGLRAKQYRFKEAGALFSRAIDLNPSFATAHQWYGNLLAWTRKPEAGLVALKKAFSLDPRSGIIGTNLANSYLRLGLFEEAVKVLRKVHDFAPDFPDGVSVLMHAEMMAGDCKNISEYGNALTGMLKKEKNSTPLYVDLCQSSDPSARARAIDAMLNWPPLNFADPGNPGLSYHVDLIDTMVELNESEAALVLMKNNMEFDRQYAFKHIRARNTEKGIAFYCDQRVQSLYREFDVPPLENEVICD